MNPYIVVRIVIYCFWLLLKHYFMRLLHIEQVKPIMNDIDPVQTMIDNKYKHRWSGWPGAHCLKCGSEDPWEIALADGWVDFKFNLPAGAPITIDTPSEEIWDTEEHRLLVEKHQICLIADNIEAVK